MGPSPSSRAKLGFRLGDLELRRESSQALEEEDIEGRSSGLVEDGFPAAAVVVLVAARRVALWMSSRGVWLLDCLPKVRGNWDLTPSYISASSSMATGVRPEAK